MQSIQQVITILRSRASGHLTDEELEILAGGTSFAQSMSLDARDLFMGLGCLIGSDEGGTGSFSSPDSAPQAFFMAAHVFDTITSLLWLSGDAQYQLDARRKAGALIEEQEVRK